MNWKKFMSLCLLFFFCLCREGPYFLGIGIHNYTFNIGHPLPKWDGLTYCEDEETCTVSQKLGYESCVCFGTVKNEVYNSFNNGSDSGLEMNSFCLLVVKFYFLIASFDMRFTHVTFICDENTGANGSETKFIL
jgi:hypothetical protein